MKKIRTLILLIPFIGMCCWVMYYAHFVKNASEVILPITGYDPRNLLSGHYIEFRINWSKADCHQLDWKGICPTGDFRGVNRFYVSENKAHELERLINNNRHETEIVFAYQAGERPVAKELLIDGRPWHGRIKRKKASPFGGAYRRKKALEIIDAATKTCVIAATKTGGPLYTDLSVLHGKNERLPYKCISKPSDIYTDRDGLTHINLNLDCEDIAAVIQEKASQYVVGSGCFVGGDCVLKFIR